MAGFVVAVTGGVASGKSAVTAIFQQLGVPVFDADLAARYIVGPGEPALAEIAERFGPGLLLPDGSLDRMKMRSLVFADPAARRDLEAITHPRIREHLKRACLSADASYVVVAVPLLAETGALAAYPWVQRIIVVDAPVDRQRARLIQRDRIQPELAEKILSAQASRSARLAIATDVITNDGDFAGLESAVRRWDAWFRHRR